MKKDYKISWSNYMLLSYKAGKLVPADRLMELHKIFEEHKDKCMEEI